MVLDNNYPPYCFLDKEGRLQGILIDRWKLWAEKTGIPVDIQGVDWLVAIDRMRNEEFDVIDTIFKTHERSAWFEFSEPHTRIDVPIFFSKEISGISDLHSLQGFAVGVKAGDAAVEVLRSEGSVSIQVFNNYEAIIQAAAKDQVHVFVIDRPAALYFLHKYGLSGSFRHTDPISSGEFHRAYLKKDTELMRRIEDGFKLLSPSDLEKIDQRWLGSTIEYSGTQFRSLLYLTIGILLLAILLVGWVQSLRWQVARRTKALQESETRLRESLEFVPVPVGIADPQGKILFLNHEFTARFGYSITDIPTIEVWMTKAYPDAAHRTAADKHYRISQAHAIATNSRTPSHIYCIQAKDGSVHEVEITMRPSGGLFLNTFNDVTQHNRILAELKQSEARYRRLHESMQDAYVRIDMDGTIVETNRAFREMLGYDDMELSTIKFTDITPEKWHAMEAAIIDKQLIPLGCSDVYEKEYIRKDGTIIPVELRCFVLKDDHDKPVFIWAIVRDLSERKRLEEQLLQAQKMEAIGQLAGGVAHDFNNILAAMMLNISMLQDHPHLDAEVHKSLEDVRGELDRATELTRQLLSFSRRQAMQMSGVDLASLLSKSLRLLQRVLGEHIHIDASGLRPLPIILANSGMLEQMIMNLCLNARDAMPQGGTLALASNVEVPHEGQRRVHPGSEPGPYIHLSISDTGTGMSETVRRRIFEPFFTTKELGHGTGLGLSIVFGIIKQHNGWIEVESTLGKGTCFHVYLPANEAAPRPRAALPATRVVEGGHERILLVEDELSVRGILSAGLRRLGYSVEVASNPADALLVWQQHMGNFDLLLTDMIMPGGVSGLELAGMLHSQKPNLHVIISSGYHKELETGADRSAPDFTRLPKPYTFEQLAQTLRQVIAPHAGEQQ